MSAAHDACGAAGAVASLADFNGVRRWLFWNADAGDGKPPKTPRAPRGGMGRVNDPATFGTRMQAEQAAGGVSRTSGAGLVLGDLTMVVNDPPGLAIGGLDLDTCVDPETGLLERWARAILDRVNTYAEVSPSGRGVKAFFFYSMEDAGLLRAETGMEHSAIWKRPGGGHPPAIELHLSNRFFIVTGDAIDGDEKPIRQVSLVDLLWIARRAGPDFCGKSPTAQPAPPQPAADDGPQDALPASSIAVTAQPAKASDAQPSPIAAKMQAALASDTRLAQRWAGDVSDLQDASGSGVALSLVGMLKARGFTMEEARVALSMHPSEDVKRHIGDRAFMRMWTRTMAETPPDAPTLPGIADGWPMPSLALLDEKRRPAPALPLAPFGAWWAKIIQDGAEGANAPPDYVAAGLLATASAAIGNARWARVWDGWTEPPFLWCAAVGNPSAGKSPGMKVVAGDPLSRVERTLGAGHPEALREWEAKVAQAKQERAAWEQAVAQAVKRGEDAPPKPAGADDPPGPSRPRIKTGDVTTEKVAHLLRDNPKGLVVFRDELAGFLGSFDRYSGGGGGGDRAAWLEAWSAGSLTVDRVKNPEPIQVPRFGVALLGSIQPDKLRPVTSGADDGLPSRFLWFWPEDGKRFQRPKVAASAERIAAALQRLAGLEMEPDGEGEARPQALHLTDDAAGLLEAAGQAWQDRERQAGGPMIGALGKARGNAVRLALVIEHLWWCGRDGVIGGPPPPSVVSAEAVRAAVMLMDGYFLPMAERVFGDAALTPAQRGARTLLREIIRTCPAEINARAVRNSARLPGLSTTDDVKAAVAVLMEEDILTPKPAPIAERGGRPRGDYLVNPRLWEAVPAQDGHGATA
ncbi:DUF3987 domain-containing protein [Roseomonas sp. CAU 1739]|uniref:DUF3987 domain-containing protein n=1 Tax=Roseomonas sp. CAU 1739 TaxID=3140364 RepID=UPI00325C32DA